MHVFDNVYYKNLVMKGWGPRLAVNGTKEKNQWKRIDKGVEKTKYPDHIEMMLNTDMCLAYDNNVEHDKCMDRTGGDNRECKQFQKLGSSIEATFGNCCAWTNSRPLEKRGIIKKGEEEQFCGHEPTTNIRGKIERMKFPVVRKSCC